MTLARRLARFALTLALVAAAVGAASTSDQAGVLLLVGTVFAAAVIALTILVAAGASDRYSYPGGEDPAPGTDPGATIVPFVVALGAGFCAVAPSSWTQPLTAVTAAAADAATTESGICHLGICR